MLSVSQKPTHTGRYLNSKESSKQLLTRLATTRISRKPQHWNYWGVPNCRNNKRERYEDKTHDGALPKNIFRKTCLRIGSSTNQQWVWRAHIRMSQSVHLKIFADIYNRNYVKLTFLRCASASSRIIILCIYYEGKNQHSCLLLILITNIFKSYITIILSYNVLCLNHLKCFVLNRNISTDYLKIYNFINIYLNVNCYKHIFKYKINNLINSINHDILNTKREII